MSKPSILSIAAWWPGKGNNEGVFIKEHINSISSYFDIHVIVLKIEKGAPTGLYRINTVTEKGEGYLIHHVRIQTRLRRFGFHNYLIKKGFQQIIERLKKEYNFKCIHIHVRNHITRVLPTLKCVINLPIIHTEHFTFYHTGINQLNQKEKEIETKQIVHWFQNQNLKKVLPVSNELALVFRDNFGCPQDKIEVVNNISNNAFQPSETKKQSDVVKILMAAAWNENKRPIQLFRALNTLESSVLHKLEIDIAGSGKLLDEARKFQEKYLPELNVTYHGFQSKEYVAALARTCDFLVHPTVSENAPTIISECLCVGLPVISMRVNGIPEMISESNGILVEKNDIESLSRAINKMIHEYSDYDRELISSQAKLKYSSESVGEKLKGIIDQFRLE